MGMTLPLPTDANEVRRFIDTTLVNDNDNMKVNLLLMSSKFEQVSLYAACVYSGNILDDLCDIYGGVVRLRGDIVICLVGLRSQNIHLGLVLHYLGFYSPSPRNFLICEH